MGGLGEGKVAKHPVAKRRGTSPPLAPPREESPVGYFLPIDGAVPRSAK